MKEIEKLFSAEEVFCELEAENPEIKEMLRQAERLENAIKKACGDTVVEYADLQTRLQYEISKYSFIQGVKIGLKLTER